MIFLALPYDENFDGMAEGLSPPTAWINQSMTIMEVDDAQAHSSPHSMKINTSIFGWGRHEEAAGWTTERVTLWVYFGQTNKEMRIASQSTTGGYVHSAITSYLWFRADGSIQYFDGAYHDTGYSYSTGWHKIEIDCNFTEDVYDVWYDDIKIITEGDFYNSADSNKQISFAVGQGIDYWVDDISIKEYVPPTPPTPEELGYVPSESMDEALIRSIPSTPLIAKKTQADKELTGLWENPWDTAGWGFQAMTIEVINPGTADLQATIDEVTVKTIKPGQSYVWNRRNDNGKFFAVKGTAGQPYIVNVSNGGETA